MIGRWSVITSAAVAALGALVCACSNPSGSTTSASASTATAQPGPWRVGAYLSLSGSDAQYGIDTKEGIELAVEEVNRAGGVKAQPIRVFYEDDKSNPQEATNKVLELVDRDKVIALLGEVTSARSKAGGIVANKKKIPMITTSTNAEVTKVGPYIFRNCFTDEAQGKWGAEFIVKSLGKKKIAVMFASDDLYSSGLAEEFRAHVKALGAEIVIEKSFGKIETNFTTYLNEIKERHPDVIYAPVYYSVMVPIARQASAVGIKGSMLVGGDGWDADELLQDAGQEMEGAYFTNHYAPDVPWESSRLFVENYKARFKHAPSGAAAQGYDAARMLFDAMGRTKGDTSDELREAIQDTKDFQGATGVITIDPERNANKSVVIVQIKGKSFKFYASLNDRQRAPTSPSASAAAPQPTLK